MNMNDTPTAEELRELIADCDDRAGQHLLWVSRNGEVQVSQVPRSQDAGSFAESLREMQLRFETFEAGNEYVGPDAAEDQDWINQLLELLTVEWAKAKNQVGVQYVDQF